MPIFPLEWQQQRIYNTQHSCLSNAFDHIKQSIAIVFDVVALLIIEQVLGGRIVLCPIASTFVRRIGGVTRAL